jgi:hypothetical protein
MTFKHIMILGMIQFLLMISLKAKAQDSTRYEWNGPDFGYYDETSIALGYNYNYAEPHTKNYHLIELRYAKLRYGGRHMGMGSWFLGSDFGLNTGRFLMGPRAGVMGGMGTLILGCQLAYYSDFQSGTLRLIPILGLGNQKLIFSINGHVRLTNRSFEPIDRGHFSIIYHFYSIKKEKLEH